MEILVFSTIPIMSLLLLFKRRIFFYAGSIILIIAGFVLTFFMHRGYFLLAFVIAYFLLLFIFDKNIHSRKIMVVERSRLIEDEISKLKEQNALLSKSSQTIDFNIKSIATQYELIKNISKKMELEDIVGEIIYSLKNTYLVNRGMIYINKDQFIPEYIKTWGFKNELELADSCREKINSLLKINEIDYNIPSTKIQALHANEMNKCIFIPIKGTQKNSGFVILDSSNLEMDEEIKDKFTNLFHQISISIKKAHFFRSIKEFSIRDSLTGVFSRRYFNERFLEDFSKAKRYKQKLAVAMIDIDDFKKLNDTYGHQFGDTVLIKITKIISDNLRTFNVLFRYGGEEFIILFPGMDSKEAYLICNRIREDIATFVFYFKHKKIISTVSIGIACFPEDAETPIEIINKSDIALYDAKNAGKNRVFIYNK